MSDVKHVVPDQVWSRLKEFTQARIGLGRVGHSLPMGEVLQFQYAHAAARDAVLRPTDFGPLAEGLDALGAQTIEVNSRARDRDEYLKRPDLGRRLDSESLQALEWARPKPECDVAFVVADGLSSFAVENHALPVLKRMLKYAQRASWRLAPVVLARQGRVALSDEVGEALGARVVAILIGERPGLSSADSLGIYLTFAPKVGNLDSGRNCISNVHGAGLSYDMAAHKLSFLLTEALRLQLSGVNLKDTSDTVALAPP
ncbi:MAG: ethanolamine ammonia-lyase subunit EutC [Gammaproteobacteria bacterium]